MHLKQLRIRDFRCLGEVDLEPASGVNVVLGENASGKSSLLEAIYWLGRGRSFRRSSAARVTRAGAEGFSMVGNVARTDGGTLGLGVVHRRGVSRIKVGGRTDAGLFDLVSAFPVQVIDPNLHRLLEEGPSVRRRYLDWGVFHVEHGFYVAWRRFRRALQQRNGALRSGASKSAVVAWDAELVRAAQSVDACRRAYVEAVARALPPLVEQILGDGAVELDYYAGWSRGEDYGSALIRMLESDRQGGFTHAGPHRADLRVRAANVQARDWVSRGQQKVISAALLLAQAQVLQDRRGIRPVLLIDDIAAELGGAYRSALMAAVSGLGAQCFVTFLDRSHIPTNTTWQRMFHVEHGRVQPVA